MVHRCLSRSGSDAMELQCEAYESVAQLPWESWQAVCSDSEEPFMDARFLSALEETFADEADLPGNISNTLSH